MPILFSLLFCQAVQINVLYIFKYFTKKSITFFDISQNLTNIRTLQNLSIVTKAKNEKKICLKANYQYKIHTMNPPQLRVSMDFIFRLKLLPYLKKSIGAMPLSNELVKINEEANIK